MHKGFYFKLAKTNLINNRRFYLPYILACSIMMSLFYCIHAISESSKKTEMLGAFQIGAILSLGTAVIGIFSIIFILYTNSFLMKRRQKEIGLFNILGMEKKHIGKILFNECLMVIAVCLLIGIGMGVLFYRLIFLVLLKLIHFSVPIKFSISWNSIKLTSILFIGLFLVTFLLNLAHIHLTKPIELLKGGQVGEREPKSKWLMTLLGLLTTGIGYSIALRVESPLKAMNLFFIAALLVIIGTYALFTAGSIMFFKHLRKNKTFYYKTNRFISVSSLIYRMKQNAVGLANICILSSAVLLMISSTVSLYLGLEDVLSTRFPKEFSIYGTQATKTSILDIKKMIAEQSEDSNLLQINTIEYSSIDTLVMQEADKFSVSDTFSNLDNHQVLMTLLTLDTYNRLSGEADELMEDQILIFTTNHLYGFDKVELPNLNLSVKTELSTFPIANKSNNSLITGFYLVAKDESMLNSIYKSITGNLLDSLSYSNSFDLKGDNNEKISFYVGLNHRINEKYSSIFTMDSREANRESFLGIYGGLLFLGIFLGLVFMIATVLIIYYKQISEGYEDQIRYEILQKVGMSRQEVKKTIESQIILVFFLPLVTAIIHIGVAFKMITRLLSILYLTNIPLFLYCTFGTMAVFALIYAGVYRWTAGVYYRIIK